MDSLRRSDGGWRHGRRTHALLFDRAVGGREADARAGEEKAASGKMAVQAAPGGNGCDFFSRDRDTGFVCGSRPISRLGAESFVSFISGRLLTSEHAYPEGEESQFREAKD